MALYCYIVETGYYEDREANILGHEDKYSHEEFDNICIEITEKYGDVEEIEYFSSYDKSHVEKNRSNHVNIHEKYRDNLLMDPLKCIHLKEVDKVMTREGIEIPLYKCDKGHSICRKSMFSPICKDYTIK